MFEHSLMTRLRANYGDHAWVPVSIGHSEARVWRLEGTLDRFVKVVGPEAGRQAREGLTREAAVLAWLAKYDLGAPEVVETGATEDGLGILVTTAVPGRSAAEPWPEAQRAAVVDALARFAQRLHALPTEACPFDRGLSVLLPLAHAQVERWKAMPGRISADRPGCSAAKVEETLAKAIAAASAEEMVVCHGDFMLPNVMIDPDSLEVSGIVDVGDLGLADRYRDLAAMSWSLAGGLNPQYGPKFADRFWRSVTGGAVDQDKAELYALLRELV
ncbi:aminoglycoside 3'-phosphotransferase [Nocardiopsis sp. NPDC049922]|uniref:aminoglycoside 3'-phosphotransferase n=1 Tax=Nocardiopsis sp. NPDC049922 TaxID=3155157 RepID=UPI0033DA6CA4